MITLIRDKGSPLSIEEIDNNLLELSKRMTLEGDQLINGQKLFNECYCNNSGSPSGNQIIRSKDVANFVNNQLSTKISLSDTEINSLTFSKRPLLNITITNDPQGVITYGYSINMFKKGIIVSTEMPVNPDYSPYNDIWIKISPDYPHTILAIYKHNGLNWIF